VVAPSAHVAFETTGNSAVGDERAIRDDPILSRSSTVKPVSAVAMLHWLEECARRLGDPMDAYLPEPADHQVVRGIDGLLREAVPTVRPITVCELLPSARPPRRGVRGDPRVTELGVAPRSAAGR
jgi:hypothetical protein